MSSKPTDNKSRRYFSLNDDHNDILALGVLYTDGNVQILWRIDLGWTAEQYNSLMNVINMVGFVTRVQFYQDKDTMDDAWKSGLGPVCDKLRAPIVAGDGTNVYFIDKEE